MFIRQRGEIFFFGRTRKLDVRRARMIVDKLAALPSGLAYLRRVLGMDVSIDALSDTEVIESISREIAAGRVALLLQRSIEADVPLIVGDTEASPDPTGSSPGEQRATQDEAPSDVSNTQDEEQDEAIADVDEEAQAETLRLAARAGAPLCEECLKAQDPANDLGMEAAGEDAMDSFDAQAQAATLEAAAAEGAPFCEECAKPKAA